MKKAFTLIELISVIIILSIIALISVPITTNIINSSRNKAYEETINNIIEISKNYSVYNNLGYNTLYKELTFDELENKGYIESSDIINPKTNQKLVGCVIYRWVIGSNQYEFKYDETCNGKASYPEIVINVTPDSESWITEKPTFDIEGEYDSFKYCIEESECNPNIDYNNRVTVEKESKNLIICATGYNNKEVGKTTCTKGYKVDRTNPTLTYNITTSTNKIIVNASCTDDISGISKKEYSINDKEYQDNNTFPNLSKGTYKISVKCTDNAGLITVKSSNVALENIKNPVIAQLSQIPANTSYAQQRIIKINYSSEGIENPEYYFKSSVAASVASGVVVQSCGTGNTPSTCTTSSVTSLVANTWYRTNNSSINVTYTSNGTLYAVTKDNTNISGTSTYSIANIDTTKPSITMKVSTKTDRATLTLTCSDTESGITKYEYSKDNGTTWLTGTTNSYTFTGLTQGTSYKYVGRCTNGSGLSNTSSSTNTTNTIPTPVITQVSQEPSSGTWAISRTLRITYNNTNVENAKYYYSYDRTNWTLVTSLSVDLKFTKNGYLYAKTTDGTNTVSTTAYSVANIESSYPSIPSITYNGGSNTCSWKNNYNLTLSSSASSGIAYYEIDVDNNGTSDGTTGSNFIPSNGWSTCSARFRAVTNAGRRSGWTVAQHIHMDTTGPSTPSITYNGGSNTCTWKNNYNLTLSSSDNIGVSYYQIDVDGNGTADSNINSNWIPENGFHSHNVRFRAVDHAGNVSAWTSNQHIHMDTTTPTTPSITGGSNVWTNTSRTISISTASSATSGIARYEYYVSNSSNGQSGGSWISGSSVTVSDEGTWYVYFRAISNASNVSGVSSYQVVKIDKTKPSISFRVKSGACVGVNAHKISCFSDAEIEIIVSDNNSASTLHWGICNMKKDCRSPYAYDLIVNNGSNDMDSSQSIIKTGSISVPLGSQVKIYAIGYDSANNSTLSDTEYFEYDGKKYNYTNIES